MAEIISTRIVHEGWARYGVATVRLDDGTVVTREIEDHGEACCVLPYDAERRTAWLIAQPRPAVIAAGGDGTSLLEAPAGLREDGEDPQACARREALEETGLRLGALQSVASVWSMPGLSTERMHLFLAPVSADDRIAEGGGLDAEHERIRVQEVSLADLDAMAASGDLVDMKTLLLAFALKLRRPDLFGPPSSLIHNGSRGVQAAGTTRHLVGAPARDRGGRDRAEVLWKPQQQS